MKKFLFVIGLIFCMSSHLSFADEEVSNRVYIQSSDHGHLYAKCFPEEGYGLKGRTLVFRIDDQGNDELLYTYDWYSPRIYLLENRERLVKLGSWPRGREVSDDHLAIALYKQGQLLKEYSTKDIVDLGYKISTSVSHYTVFQEVLGFRWLRHGDEYAFDIKMWDDSILSFDTNTGEVFVAQ